MGGGRGWAGFVGPTEPPLSLAGRRQQGRSRAHNPVPGTCRGSEFETAASVRVSAVCGDAFFHLRGGAMPRTEKLERVAELKRRIEGSAALLLAEYRGLTVS